MAQWFDVSSATTKGKGLQGHFDIDGGEGWFQQDLTPFVEKAKEDRHFVEHHGQRADGYRKFATIPDAVALKILEDHHINPLYPNTPCLLYTSPSPRDRQKSRMPSSA